MLRVARHFSTEVLDALSRTERHPGEVARERCSIAISGQKCDERYRPCSVATVVCLLMKEMNRNGAERLVGIFAPYTVIQKYAQDWQKN